MQLGSEHEGSPQPLTVARRVELLLERTGGSCLMTGFDLLSLRWNTGFDLLDDAIGIIGSGVAALGFLAEDDERE